MASNTRETWKRRLRRRAKAGRKRKNQDSRNSTPSSTELFAALGKPGEAAPKAAPKPAAAKPAPKPVAKPAAAAAPK
jgi:hypothetical protein